MKSKKAKKKAGPKLKRLDPETVESIAAMGGTNEQIASALGVSAGTLFNIRKREPKIEEAIQRGKDKADLQMVSALFRKGIGSYICPHCGKKIPGVLGDTTAMIFWLKNRRSKEWRDRHDIEHSGNVTAHLSIDDFRKNMKNWKNAK